MNDPQTRLWSINEAGSFLVIALIMILLVTAIGAAISGLVAVQYQHTRRELYVQNAELTAEAGIEQSVHQLNVNSTFNGYTTPQQFFNDSVQGVGTFTATITTNSDNSKTIVSTGNVYRSASASTPYITRSVRVTVVGTSSSGYSVFAGPGGLNMSGLASITNTSVYVGGYINMSGLSSIGTDDNPANLNVANDQCPTGASPGSTYPVVCSNGTQPINATGWSQIYGTVCATGQTDASHISGGNGGAGLQAGCTTPVNAMPTYNRAAQISAVTTTASGTSNSYTCQSGWNNTRTWPANLELTGNVAVNGFCNITVNGDVYITGNLTVSDFGSLIVGSGLSTTPHIIVDGTITVNGLGSMQPNSSGTGLEFISFKSAAACGASCTTLSGNDLYNSAQQQTISISGIGYLPGMIFDAYWGAVTVGGINLVGAVAGQTVNLNTIGTVMFGTQLASGSKTWNITSYQPLYSG